MGAWQGVAGGAIVVVAGIALHALLRVTGVAASTWAAVRRPATWLIGLPVFLVVLLLGVPFVYVQATSTAAPPPLRIEDLPGMQPSTTSSTAPATSTPLPTAALAAGAPVDSTPGPAATGATGATTIAAPTTTTVSVDGGWVVGPGSEARYGIDDTVMGSSSRVVGRTRQLTGSMQIVHQAVTAAKVIVDMRTVSCGCIHDSKYQQLLETSSYPYSQFELTSPIPLSQIPPQGVIVQIPVTGRFTIHGVTREVHFTLDAARRNSTIAINATIPVKLGDYNIQQPNAGPFGGIDNATIDLLIAFTPAR
jgi:polyisoprenoid-binding protein YceI